MDRQQLPTHARPSSGKCDRSGAFARHDTGRWLVDKSGQTEGVHPLNSRWTRYIDFKNLTRMERR